MEGKSGQNILDHINPERIDALRRPEPPNTPSQLGLYLHVPFCFHKCHYCDFYSIVDSRDRQEQFARRLAEEINSVGNVLAGDGGQPGPCRPREPARRPQTIFIGGGTPTLLNLPSWQRLLDALAVHFPAGDRPSEFTVEANPETVTPELAALLASGGVNRISIGAQSFNPAHLKTLERWHDPANVCRSVEILRDAGIDNINLDLIFGIPGQTIDQWRDDLRTAIELEPTHLSCYMLMYEPNTPLTKRMQMGQVTPIDDEVEAAMYDLTREMLREHGYEHYEISAWAKPGRRCEHNLIYWRNHDWWPLGPSASGHVRGMRWKNVARLAEYLASESLPPITDLETLDDDGRVGEALMLGLRVIDGVALDELDRLLALGRRGRERAATIERHINSGLLARSDSSLHLTDRGLLVADTVIAELL
jgi:oxygen-independent coproporphyrinogen III oxidase